MMKELTYETETIELTYYLSGEGRLPIEQREVFEDEIIRNQ